MPALSLSDLVHPKAGGFPPYSAFRCGFVITFEELVGMFEAKGIKLEEIEPQDEMQDATGAGRGYGVAGGVAAAIEECIREYYPDVDVNIEHAESLAECKRC